MLTNKQAILSRRWLKLLIFATC